MVVTHWIEGLKPTPRTDQDARARSRPLGKHLQVHTTSCTELAKRNPLRYGGLGEDLLRSHH